MAGLAVLAVAFSLAACDSGSSTTAATQPPTPAATSSLNAPTAETTASLGAHSVKPGTTFLAMQTAEGGEFVSPSDNISCEINDRRGGPTNAYCQTVAPARSVTLTATGHYSSCTGEQCLGNPGEDTPTLPYGTATGVGPFRCESAPTGVTCLAAGRGFRISTSGITSVPS